MATQSYTGKIGDAYTATLPAGYQDYAIMQGDLTGTFSATVHEAYVYLSNQDADKYTPVVQSITVVSGTIADEALAKSAIANAAQLPEGTKYVWTKVPNTATLGDQEGELQVQYPDHTTDTVNVLVTVTGKAFPTLPDLLLVDNATNLSDAEKTTLLQRLKEANKGLNNYWQIPSDISAVAADGTVTVAYDDWGTSNDYSVEIPGSLLVRKKQFADVYAPTTPATKVGVKNTQNLQADEKAKVKQAIIDANQANPAWTDRKVKDVVIASDGTATILYTDNSTDTIVGTDLVTSLQSGHHMVVMPEKILVVDPADLSPDEKQAALRAVRRENPESEETHVVSVGFADNAETTVMVTYDDGSHNYVEVSQLVKAAMLFPTPTPVQNLTALTPEEKATLKKAIEDKNANYFPTDYLSDTSLVTVAVNNDGSATITYNTMDTDGETLIPGQSLTIPADRLVKLADKVAHQAQTPDQKTPVVNKAQLNDTEKEKVATAILDYNHKQGNTFLTKDMIKIADDGTATITYPDKTSMSIPGTDLVSQYAVTAKTDQSVPRGVSVNPKSLITVTDKDGNAYDLPADAFTWKTPLDNSKVADQATGVVTVKLSGTSVEVPVTVKVVASQADQAVAPAPVGYDLEQTITSVKDAIAQQLQTANPDATVEVAENGDATLTFKDGSVKTFKANELAQGYQIKVVNTKIIKGNSKPAHSFIQVLDEAGQPVAGLDNKEIWLEEPKWDQVTDHTLKGKINVTLPGAKQLTVTRDVSLTVVDNLADQVQTPEKVGYFIEDGIKDPVKDAVKQALVAANTDGDQQTLFTLNQIEIADDGTVTISFPGQTATKQFKLADLTTAYTVADAKASAVHEVGSLAAKDAVTITGENPAQVKAEWQTGPDLSKTTDNGSGTVKVTLPGGVSKSVDVTYQVTANEADQIKPVEKTPVDNLQKLQPAEVQKVKDAIKKTNSTLTDDQIKVALDGSAVISLSDGSVKNFATRDLVVQAESAVKEPAVPETKVPVAKPGDLNEAEQGKVKKAVEDKNADLIAGGATVSVDKSGEVTVKYSDGTSDTLTADQVTKQAESAVKEPAVPETKVPVAKPGDLSEAEQGEVKKAVEDKNADLIAGGATVSVDKSGEVTVKYGDGTTDKVPDTDLVKVADNNYDVNTETNTKVPVKDPAKLSDDDKQAVVDQIRKDNPNLPGGDQTQIEVSADGSATITYPDGTQDSISGDKLVIPDVKLEIDAQDKIYDGQPSPFEVTLVDGKGNHLTLHPSEGDLAFYQIKDGVKVPTDLMLKFMRLAVMPSAEPTLVLLDEVPVDPGHYEIRLSESGKQGLLAKYGNQYRIENLDVQTEFYIVPVKDAVNPNVPTEKVLVNDPTNLSDGEKSQVKDNVVKANQDDQGNSTLPKDAEIKVGNDGTVTITYADGSEDTINGSQLVEQNEAGKTNPTIPDKTKVDDPTNLSDGEKDQVKDNVEKNNPGTTVTVGDDGTATIKYPDQSTDTIPGQDLVEGKTDAEKTQPTVPGDKTKVDDPSNLSDGEKDQVKDNVEKSNPGTTVTVDNDGTATIKYPDQSTDTIPGKDLVTGKTDAEKTQPTVPGDKTKVDDPSNLSDGEKAQVKDNVEKSNPGTTVTVDNDGTAKITYPDKSTDTIPGKDLVAGKTDAEKTQPTVPEDKTKVDDPSNLTAGEKDQVKTDVEKVNPETTVTVANDGTATITYPDGSKATISGDQLVKGKTDAEKATPNLPTTKTPVQDPSHLTSAEQAAVQANVAKANAGAVVTVDAQGNATLTYPDGSQLTLKADQLVKAAVNATVAPSPSAATPAPTPAATPVQAAALPQTGDANATALALSGLTLALIGLIGAKKKRSEEN